MSTAHAAITLVEFLAAAALIYGFAHEEQVARFEQKMIRKAKRAIYNLIVKLEAAIHN